MKFLGCASVAAALLAACNAELAVDSPDDAATAPGGKDTSVVEEAPLPPKDAAPPDKPLPKDTTPRDTAVADAPPPVSAAFMKVYMAVFQKYACTGCHSPGEMSGGLSFVGAANVFASIVDKSSIGCPDIKRIDPGKPETSLILALVRYDTLTDQEKALATCNSRKRAMPPGGMVDPADAQVLEDWISAGAK